MTSPGSKIYKIAFSMLKGMKPDLAEAILAVAGSEEMFFSLSSSQLSAANTRRNMIFDDAYRKEILEKARKEEEYLHRHNIRAHYIFDDDYPIRLKEAPDAPMMIYTLGECELDHPPVISVVGTRHATPYGLSFIRRLIEELAAKLAGKPVIVSGLALGIDIAAHLAAIKNGLPTVAVLAHNLKTIYPAEHRSTASEIARGKGMLLTEYTSDSQLHRGNFLARNRIIAGLADCTIVVESAERGGALVTARCALGYNRDVFAVPGRIGDPYSSGCNRLIASNIAALITSADDLISAMGWETITPEGTQNELAIDLAPDEQAIVDLLAEKGEARVNEIAISLNTPIHKVMKTLVDLEFKELVTVFPGGLYRLS